MADNNRNRGGYRSFNQEFNEGNRYGQESGYDDRGIGGSYGSRYESGNYGGSQSGRYGQDYGESNLYSGGRYDREPEYNRGWSGDSQFSRTNRDSDRDYNSRNYENRGGSSYGSSNYGGYGDMNTGYSRYGREYQSYTPGSYQNYAGESGYGSSFGSGHNPSRNFGSGYGTSSYGDNFGRSGYGSGSNYGGYDMGRRDYDQNRGYGTNLGGNYRGQQDRNWWDRTTDEVSSWFGDDDAERRRRADRMHKGRGPRNYKRSDERIKEDINDRLSDDWYIDASDIDVTVQNGEVTLTGKVEERSAKRRAEDIAEAVSGVTNVENRIRVARETENFGSGSMGSSSSTATSTERSRTKQSALADINSK